MKRILKLGIVIIVLIAVGLTACSPKTTSTSSAEDTGAPTAEVVVETQASDGVVAATPTIDVEALILEKLQGNHSIDRVLAAQKTREEWNTTLDRMIGYGAKISEEEKKIIIDYLLSR